MSDSVTLGVSPVNDQASRRRYSAAVNARTGFRMLPTPPPSNTNSPFFRSRVPSWAVPEALKHPDDELNRGSKFLPAPPTPPLEESPFGAGIDFYPEQAAPTASEFWHGRSLPPTPLFESQVQYVQPQFAGHYVHQPQTLTASLTPPPASPIYMQPPVTHQPRPHQAINHARLSARATLGSMSVMLDGTPHLPPPTPTHAHYTYSRFDHGGMPLPRRPMSAVDPRIHVLRLEPDFGPPIAKSRSAPPAPLASRLSPVREPDDDLRAVYLKARPGSRPAPPSESRIMAYPSGALRNRTPDEIEKLRRGSLVAFLKGQHPLVIEKDLETQIARERQERRRANANAGMD
ncbi:hypothetical protein BKA62DRAFT_153102 [Auriculariales sp. MPI-PUGE-AT-0066]|nr:hypothetical protein BKA62DRAFT_153102 [Auriculariales sp. MPI-PUGE-AT-0066]